MRRASLFNTARIDHLNQDPHEEDARLFLHYADLTDSSSLIGQLHAIRPDEVYNLGAQSHVKVSFEMPEFTAETAAMGTLRMLEAVRPVVSSKGPSPASNITDVNPSAIVHLYKTWRQADADDGRLGQGGVAVPVVHLVHAEPARLHLVVAMRQPRIGVAHRFHDRGDVRARAARSGSGDRRGWGR